MSENLLVSFLARLVRALASLKLAIPLIVILTVATVVGSLFPDPVLFRSYWYLGLLGLLGVSLLLITILHIPLIMRRKGRNAMIGVVATHAGILILIAGAIFGGLASFRHQVRAIEQEMTVVPGLPFVVRLDSLEIEEYPEEAFSHVRPDMVPRKKQDSHITLYRNGQPWTTATASPGWPMEVDGIKILPLLSDYGWYFELIVTDPMGREKTIPVRPWSPPVIQAGSQSLMAHSMMDGDTRSVQLFTIENGQMKPLGIVSASTDLDLDGYRIRLGGFKRYTGLTIYNRPHAPVLVLGTLLMMAGLLWHFYHRYKEQGPKD